MTILSISVTEAGRQLADRLPYEHVHGDMGGTIRARWSSGHGEGFVVFAATGAVVRVIGPLLADKHRDPTVVSVDEAGRFVVALAGGHAGANQLARTVAGVLGAEPVITTATDAAEIVGLDELPGYHLEGDVAGVAVARLDGRHPIIDNPRDWPLPSGWIEPGDGPERLVVSDQIVPSSRLANGPAVGSQAAPVACLRPPSLVVGIGSSTTVEEAELQRLVGAALADGGLSRHSVTEIATIDRRHHHPAVAALGLPIKSYPAEELDAVPVPHPSRAVAAAVRTSSVCEAAAILAAGPGGELVVPKTKSANATVAVARRMRPVGRVTLVGLGPGSLLHRTAAAERAVRRADVVIGYDAYVDQCDDLLSIRQQVIRSPLGSEMLRARQALDLAGTGLSVAMVCSGDAGIYAMASPVFELTAQPAFAAVQVEVVPGVTAGVAAASLLGAPLGHDHVLLSLSDLLTPWELIEARLNAAACADLVVVLYNPRSMRRTWQLDKAMGILASRRPPSTPVGVVTDAGRPSQRVVLTDMVGLDPATVTMTSCVIVGSSTTTEIHGRMVTPRGYIP